VKIKAERQLKFVILLSAFLLTVLSLVTISTKNVQAQSGFLRCYNRKLEHQEVDCSLCDNLTTSQINTNKACKPYDASNCTCPTKKITNCDSLDSQAIEDRALGCSESGYFWNDNYCECFALDGKGTITNYTNAKSGAGLRDSFFSVNWDGNLDNIPEMIRFVLIAVFTVIAVVALFLGIYGIYLYTNAGENDDQIKTANKVFKNALIGIGIAVFGVVLVQGVAFLLGVSPDEMFTFKF